MTARRLLSIGAATTVVAAGLAALPATSASAATTYKACANKKTGEMRLVVKGKKCKKNEKKLKWNTKGPAGQPGTPGAQGPQGATGVRGPAGSYNAIDQTGAVIGPFFGLYVGFPIVRLPSGALLAWSNAPGDSNALMLTSPLLYFRQAGCAGDAYGVYPGGVPFDFGIVMGTPAAPGKPVYRLAPGTPQSFTALSTLDPSGCTAVSTAITDAYVAKPAGTVPTVVQPLYFEPVG